MNRILPEKSLHGWLPGHLHKVLKRHSQQGPCLREVLTNKGQIRCGVIPFRFHYARWIKGQKMHLYSVVSNWREYSEIPVGKLTLHNSVHCFISFSSFLAVFVNILLQSYTDPVQMSLKVFLFSGLGELKLGIFSTCAVILEIIFDSRNVFQHRRWELVVSCEIMNIPLVE